MEEPLYFPPKTSQEQGLVDEKLKQQDQEDVEEPQKTNNNVYESKKVSHKLGLLPLIFVIYFHVSGGPYGQEPAVGTGGPLFAILGFLTFPFLWGLPEALVTAELSTTFPLNGGFVVWAHTAFGPFWAYLLGSWKFISGVINLATFPSLCISYVEAVAPSLATSALTRFSTVFLSTLILSLTNYLGIKVVGYLSIPLGFISLAPFIVLSFISIPRIDPSNWVVVNQVGRHRNRDWKLFFNYLFWNLNSWDNVSTLAGEIKSPPEILPKALTSTLGLTSIANFIPLLASIGAVSLNVDHWVDGYYAEVADDIAGPWLRQWIQVGSVLSSCGLYQAQLGSCTYQLQGMAKLGLLPRVFAFRGGWFNTPWFSILFSALTALAVSALGLDNLRVAGNFLYSLGILVELFSFVSLRVKFPTTVRPYKVPVDGLLKLTAMCSVPGIFVLYVMCVAGIGVHLLTLVLTFVSVAFYFVIKILRTKRLLEFDNVDKKIVDEGPLSYEYEEIVK